MTINDTDNPFSSWTEKEIREQPLAIRRSINFGSRIESDFTQSRLGGLSGISARLLDTEHVILMGCGTSYHACLLIAPYYRQIPILNTVQVCDASEFDMAVMPKSGATVVIVVSQSGETIDLALSIQKIRAARPSTLILGVINVVDSLIANEVDAGVYTNCGKERGVASTKSFVTQVIVMLLMSFYFLREHTYSPLLKDMLILPLSLENHMEMYFDKVQKLLPDISRFQNIFVVGRSYDYYIAMEASLKIKEISYVHSEAYSSSSLKHGPFALLDETMLVIIVSTIPADRKKIENAYQEIHSRKSPILVISYENMFDCPLFISVPSHSLSFLEAVCVLQIIALGLCNTFGHNPDYPRNLAKVVTVE
jgi:glucosamine--fructose-6-phosphate aminotransferase (isomerizing)